MDSDDKITVDSLVTKCENCVSQDILENEDVKLDHMFMASLIADIVKVLLSCLLIIITLFLKNIYIYASSTNPRYASSTNAVVVLQKHFAHIFFVRLQLAISDFTAASISRRAYVRSLRYEYRFSFILQLELITGTKVSSLESL